ncbi:MAG: protoheme IX farnesyltransferase [candidate division Zixibacteria bacterium]|nr:protoheme IX farnesyltransferase [candidate division Zixibacteria bacterium]
MKTNTGVWGAFVSLTKPGLALMLVITTGIGFYLATNDVDFGLLIHTLVGTMLAAGGTLALNQYMERDRDAMMRRTRQRPLPAGLLTPNQALWFSLLTSAVGLGYLALIVNTLSAAVTGAITATYLLVYTPLKHRTTLATVAGAIPGALPPVTGWTAVRGEIEVEAIVLFLIMFLWQLPHALALAWVFREDYERAGFYLLPAVDPDGRITSVQIFVNCMALSALSLLPTLIGLTGMGYFYTALTTGLVLSGFAVHLVFTRSIISARRLFFATLGYLVILFTAMAVDKV